MPLFRRHFIFPPKAAHFGGPANMGFALMAGLLAFFVLGGVFLPTNSHADSHEQAAAETATSTITDDEIDGFLFRVSDETKSKIMELSGEPTEILPVPVLFGVSIGDFSDTWGESRAGGRAHNGTDIIAPKGELVVSPTKAVVTKVGRDNKGGNYVITANPGGEQFYFAHLDAPYENLEIGDVLEPGDLIGYVGNTGNARGKSPHLHFGIYYKGLAKNPFPRLVREFSDEEKLSALEKVLAKSKVISGQTGAGVRFLQGFLIQYGTGIYAKRLANAGATGYFGSLTKQALAQYQSASDINPASGYFGPITKANILASIFPENETYAQVAGVKTEAVPEPNSMPSVAPVNKDLETGSSGKEVIWLQNFLIKTDSGPQAEALSEAGATGYFGIVTKKALAEYQEAVGIDPASGYFGPLTRAHLANLDIPAEF